MTLLSPNHNHAADECIAQIPQHHIPTAEEKVRASECFNKSILVAAHMAALHDAYILEMATHPVNEVVIKPSSPTSSIGGLKSSTLKQLKVGKVHRRRVLCGTLCEKTLCTKGLKGFMVANVLEDEEGNATPIYLSDAMEGSGGSMQAQQMYPQDSKVAVKEPYLTRFPDGEIVLLVEKTTDLVFLWVPEIVRQDGDANGDPQDSELYKDGTDAFAVDKTAEAYVDGGDSNEGVEEDGGVNAVADQKGNDKPGEDDAFEEAVECSKASRELKFKDVVNVKKKEGSDGMANDGKLQSDPEEISSGEGAMEEGSIRNDSMDVKEEETKEEVVEASEAESTVRNSVDVKEEETKEEVVEASEAESTVRNSVDVKEEETKEVEVEAADKLAETPVDVQEQEAKEGEAEAADKLAEIPVDVQEQEAKEGEAEVEAADKLAETPVDVQEQEAKEGEAEAADKLAETPVEIQEQEAKEGDAEAADKLAETPVDVQEQEAKEGEVKAAEAAVGDLSRGLSLDDMRTVHEGEQDGGNIVRERGGEEGGNAPEVLSVKSGVIDVGGAEEEPLNGDLNQGELGAPPVDVVSGETASSLRVKGNTIFAQGDFNKAASAYAYAVKKARADGLKMEEILCLSNRAEVWIRLSQNQAAFDDAEDALKLLREYEATDAGDLTQAKALFRKGRALMGLHKYKDAMNVLQEVLAKAPADRQLREAAIKCRNRLQQKLKPGKRQRAAAKRRNSLAAQ